MMDRVSLESCFKLGQTLRDGDAESFLSLYDDFKFEKEKDLDVLKEVARQISDLPSSLFSILQVKHCERNLDKIEVTSKLINLNEICDNLQKTIAITSDSGIDDLDTEHPESPALAQESQKHPLPKATASRNKKSVEGRTKSNNDPPKLNNEPPKSYIDPPIKPRNDYPSSRRDRRYPTPSNASSRYNEYYSTKKRRWLVSQQQYQDNNNNGDDTYDHYMGVDFLWKRWIDCKQN